MITKWPLVALSDIASPVSRPIPVEAGKPYRTIGVKWWGAGAYERETIDGSQTAAKTLSIVKSDDLIINKIWVRNGSTAIATKSVDGCAASGEFPTFSLNRELVEPRWLHWLTKNRSFWSECADLSRGTSGKNRIKPELFLSIRIPLPPLSVQRQLLNEISYINANCDEIVSIKNEINKMQQQLLMSLFTGLLKESKYMEMGEIAPIVRRPITIDLLNGVYPELGIRSFWKGTFHKPALSGADVGTKKLFKIEPGDLVFSNVFAWEGAMAIAKPEDKGRVGSHRFITCVAKEGVANASYLHFYFQTPEGFQKIKDASPGGAGRNRTLGLNALAKIEVPLPSFEKQLWFHGLCQQIDSLKCLQTETEAELDAVLPSILDKAFKGELIVNGSHE